MAMRGQIARFWKNSLEHFQAKWGHLAARKMRPKILERGVAMADAITLQVEGMSCGHCIRAVTNAITALDQAAKVEVDLAAKRVVAQTSLPRADVVRAVEEEGFAVKG
jgi:copper chaperone